MRQIEGIGENIGGDKQSAAAAARGLPVGVRLLVILGTGLLGWAVPLGILYLLW